MLCVTVQSALTEIAARLAAAATARRSTDQRGQASAEYALVLLGAAAVALLVTGWAVRTNRVGRLLDAVMDQLLDRVKLASVHRRRRRATRSDDRGQAAVELALTLPLLALLLLLVVQAALVVRDQVLVVHAAREAARAAAVDPSPGAARAAALAGAPLDPDRTTVRVGAAAATGQPVSVTVRYRTTSLGPLLDAVVPDIVVEGRASMRREF